MNAELKGNLIEDRLVQLRCHFTWELQIEDTEMTDLENRVFDEIEFLDTKFNVPIHNLWAYVQHLKGQNKEALQSLKQAEDLVQTEQDGQAHVRRLVTWGNYAWLYYHMGRLEEARMYLDKVESTCKEFASPFCYTVDSPHMDCEEGWALLKCGGKNYERAKACFEKALEVDPEHPEFNTGYAIAVYRLDGFIKVPHPGEAFCLQTLKRAIELNPEDAYMKALLALKLQDIGQEAEGEKYIEEALTSMSSQTYVYRYAAKFYRRKGSVDKALHFLKMALRATPSSAFIHHQVGLCYKAQMIQIKKANNWRPRGRDEENIHRLVQKAICEFEKALELRPRFHMVYIDLAEMYAEMGHHRKAEDIFQKLLSMGIFHDHLHQDIHFRYGRFQEFHMKSEVNAVIHYLKAINKGNSSFTSNKSLNAVEKLVLRKLRRNGADVESLSILGFVCKLKGEMHEALEWYEHALRLAAGSENSVGPVL
ncbi:interferon-induced protein with tetratricopeptide repeats 1B-like isoform X1 [Phyllostomus discolor]|uniref:Interferon-induced protein with tetratricopeptide repeats 1B-like isoform X1 n=1 Tax=Phyllostomus discolor TaxID=89673 RepID=A0A6J2LRJ3_9CHIR|nr:interferon-induced protein with tetratricopeptide repeats 1B-like isoform X1 [Phyllostomus discolor]